MARIPDFLPRVAEQPMQTPNLQAPQVRPAQNLAGAQLQNLGEAVQQAGTSGMAIASHLQDLRDEARALEADTLFADKISQTMRGDNGYLFSVGKEADDRREETLKSIDDAHRELEKTLQNPFQRQLFGASAQQHRAAAYGQIQEHAAKELRTYAAAEATTRLGQLQNNAVDYANGDEPSPAYVAATIDQANQIADFYKWLPDSAQRKALKEKAVAGIHVGMMKSMMAEGRSDDARSYLEKYGGDLDASTRAEMQDHVQRGSIADRSLALSLQLRNKSPEEVDSTLLAKLQSKEITAEVYDATRNRIDAETARTERQFAKDRKDTFEWLTNLLAQPGNESLTIDDVNKARGTELTQLRLWDDVKAWFNADRQFTTSGEGWSRRQFLLEHPTELMKLTPDQLWSELRFKLSDRDFNVLMSHREQILGKTPPAGISVQSKEQLVEATMRRVGLLPPNQADDSTWFKSHPEMTGRHDDFRRNLDATLESEKTPPTMEMLRQKLDLIELDQVHKDKSMTQGTVALASIPKAERDEVWVTVSGPKGPTAVNLRDIAATHQAQIVEALRNAGMPPTVQNIAATWVAGGSKGLAEARMEFALRQSARKTKAAESGFSMMTPDGFVMGMGN